MDEFTNNPFDASEIDKIQAEIEKDLLIKTKNADADANDGNDCFFAEEPSFEHGKREIVADSIISHDYGVSIDENTVNSSSDLFKETVKNQNSKNSKPVFSKILLIACVCSVLGGISIGAGFGLINSFWGNNSFPAQSEVFQEPNFAFVKDQVNELASPSLQGVFSYADLIDTVEPAVVCISSNMPVSSIGGFYVPSDEFSLSGGGSGIIFDKDNDKLYIVTNDHVVSGANSVFVSVNGSEEVPASLVGRESGLDIAVISVEIKDLQKNGVNDFTIATFGSSENMRAGDFVIAIGNSLGMGNSATFGFVSAVNKNLNIDDMDLTVIQTDAAINPGNSGGPLINLKGEVIGINMVKFVEASVEGTGYALTSDVVMPIIEQIRNQKPRPMLGVVGYNMTQTVADAFSLPMMGVIVNSVVEGSGADLAGIQANDIITSLDGQTILSIEQLSEEVQKKQIGDVVEVKLIRSGQEIISVNVTLYENKIANF